MEENNETRNKVRHSHTEKKEINLKKIIIGAITALFIIIIAFVAWYNISLSGTGKADDKVTIEIAMGSGTNKIASLLKENDLIRSEAAFKLYTKLNKINSFQAGKYSLTKNMSVSEIVQALQTGKVFKEAKVKIIFVEGKTFRYVAKQIADNTQNTEEDVYSLIQDEEYIDSLIDEYWFITDEIKNKDIYYPLEGYLFPDTYSFEEEDVSVKDIFKRMLDQMDKVLSNYKNDIENSKHTVHELLTVASITENEAIFDKDRKDVTSVIYNRLKKNMSVGSDVTTYYASKIDLGTRDLYRSEINNNNAYNTRGPNMNGKLPIGPISMPSKASIEAAIYPNTTEYLFFVADAKGNIYFTKTNAEHEAKVKELKENGDWIEF